MMYKGQILKWDVYEISSEKELLQGVKLRGRVRKFGILNNINIIIENVELKDGNNKVRFAVLNKKDSEKIISFVKSVFPSTEIKQVLTKVENPVLSKLKINKEERYNLG